MGTENLIRLEYEAVPIGKQFQNTYQHTSHHITDLITAAFSASDLARYGYTLGIHSGCVRYECLSLHSPWSANLPQKLIVRPMLYKFATSYGTSRLITALIRPTTRLYPEPDRSSPVQATPSCFMRAHFSIILQTTPRFSN